MVRKLGSTIKAAKKKLIEFGWDEQDTAFLRRHVKQMEQTPFDGCVFHVKYTNPEGKSVPFTWQCWGKRAFRDTELQPALNDLKATRFHRFRHNFLRFDVTPGDVDWFDDFSAVIQNARLAARIAREGRAKGILFDIEQYESHLFEYGSQQLRESKSWEEYAAQVRRRGREVMEAFQQGFPDVVVFTTFGYSLPWGQSQGNKKPLSECSYGLLAPFLDGMLEAARGKARIVEGNENAYGYRDVERFPASYRLMREGLLPMVADPAKYARVFSFSFGIWMDGSWRQFGWHTDDFTKNFHTPETFQALVAKALEVADEYVWIYTEQPRWWSYPDGRPVNLPAAYEAALRRARKR